MMTSLGSPLSKITAMLVLFLVCTRYCCNAATASNEGIATWFSSTPLSERIIILAPSLCALSTSTNKWSIALSSEVFL